MKPVKNVTWKTALVMWNFTGTICSWKATEMSRYSKPRPIEELLFLEARHICSKTWAELVALKGSTFHKVYINRVSQIEALRYAQICTERREELYREEIRWLQRLESSASCCLKEAWKLQDDLVSVWKAKYWKCWRLKTWDVSVFKWHVNSVVCKR